MSVISRDALIAALIKRARILLTCEPELDDPAGHFAYDTEKENADAVAHVRALADASEWGWCSVRVRACFGGFHGDDHLGACSYESREAFERDDYYTDMVREACGALADRLIAAKSAIASLLDGVPDDEPEDHGACEHPCGLVACTNAREYGGES